MAPALFCHPQHVSASISWTKMVGPVPTITSSFQPAGRRASGGQSKSCTQQSVYMPLSKLSHLATHSCVSKAGKQSSEAAKTQVQLLRKMERMAIGASHGVLVITETGQNSKVKEVLRDRRQTQRGGSSKFTQARMLGFRPNSKPSAQNWERDCKGVGVRNLF